MIRLILIALLTTVITGCAVTDLVQICTTTPEACTSGANTEYIRVNGETYIIERGKL